MKEHTVESGDTLSRVASQYHVSLPDLIISNPQVRDPAHLSIGQVLRIPDGPNPNGLSAVKAGNTICQQCEWIRMQFDGKSLKIIRIENDTILKQASATSGLPPNAPHTKQLIAEGRKDLSLSTDYRQPKYQSVPDAGPIPEGTYTLPLSEKMEFEKSGGGWGVGGWRLEESFWGKADNIFGGRSGFFLHQDGGHPGTAGCIGVKGATHILKIRTILQHAHQEGQTEVEVKVTYAK